MLLNANHIIYGTFHQNDQSYSEQSRGFQCTCNSLCMVTYTSYGYIDSGSVLDEILHHSDILYQNTINVLKREGKFINALLSLDEIPVVFEVENVQYKVEKQSIVSGVLVKINKYEVVSGTTTTIVDNFGLPTLQKKLCS